MLKVLREPCILLRVQSWQAPTQAPQQLERALNTEWPLETGTVSRVSGIDVLCTGPTDWLVMSHRDGHDIAGALLKAVSYATLRATDVSNAFVRFELDGPHAREILSKGCALDLRHDEFVPERCSRTRIAGMSVVLWCTGESRFECVVSASHADFFTRSLTEASPTLKRRQGVALGP